MKLTREVELRRHVMRAHQVVLAAFGCLSVALASQQCAGQARSRLDAAIARDPLPRVIRDVAREVRGCHAPTGRRR